MSDESCKMKMKYRKYFFGIMDLPDGGREETLRKKIISVLLAVVWMLTVITGCGSPTADRGTTESDSPVETSVTGEDLLNPEGSYTTKEDVALYLELYNSLPDNFITKKEARKLGWEGGSLEPYAPGYCIGGDRYGNYEGRLPKNVEYRECDINTLGAKKRGVERLVFAGEDGDITAIYYTGDHYKTFEPLYESP